METFDLIVLGGAPGVGKSTLASHLRSTLAPALLEFSAFRQPHLNAAWSDASPNEEAMAFENVAFVVRNYVRSGYRNVVLTDLRDERLASVPGTFSDLDIRIVTLVLADDDELRRRLRARTEGYRDIDSAAR